MSKTHTHIRQGDVLVIATDAAPKAGAKDKKAMEKGRVILAHGEVTGHAHELNPMGVDFVTHDGCEGLLEIKDASNAVLTHQEHAAIDLAKLKTQFAKVYRQVEYDGQDLRAVQD
jgi:hypothetical protein